MPKKYFISPKEDKLNRLKDAAFKFSNHTVSTARAENAKANTKDQPQQHGENDFALNLELKEDLARIYTVGEDGTLRRPFRGANLTDDQVIDILENAEGKYYYVKAGETQPLRIDNGFLVKPEEGTLPPAIEELKNREIPPMEVEGRKAANSLWEMKRMWNDLGAMYGQSLGYPGSDNYRSYVQNIVHHTEQAGGDVEYLSSKEKPFTEMDFVALSMASMGDTKISGDNYALSDPEASGYACVSILPGDIFIHRVGNEQHADWIAATRNATADAIRQYVEDGDPSLLAEHIARSIDNIGLVASRPAEYNVNAMAQMYPASAMDGLLRNHPDLLDAAQKYAQENGLAEQFQRGMENCRLAVTLIQVKQDELQARQHMANNPELTEEQKKPFKENIALAELINADMKATTKGAQDDPVKTEALGKATVEAMMVTHPALGLSGEELKLTDQGRGAYLDIANHEVPKSALMGLLNEVTEGKGTISRTGYKKIKDYIAQHDLADGLNAKDALESMKKDGLLSADGLDHSGTILDRASTLKEVKDIMAERRAMFEWAKENGITKEDAMKSGLSLSEYAAKKQAEAKVPPERRKPERPLPPKAPAELVEPKYENMKEPTPPEAPELSFGDRFTNFFKRLFTGRPIDKVARYEAEVAKYEAARVQYEESQARDQEVRAAYSAARMEQVKGLSDYREAESAYRMELNQYHEKLKQFEKEAKPTAETEQRVAQAVEGLQNGTYADRVLAVAEMLAYSTYHAQGMNPTRVEVRKFANGLMETKEFNEFIAPQNMDGIVEMAKKVPNGLKLGNELLKQMNAPKKQVVASAPQVQKVKEGPQIGV